MSAPTDTRSSIWHQDFRWVTLGAIALIFLAALQSLAVTTVMPVVSEELNGAHLYAVAFAGTLATSVIGMVVTGTWCDRSGPRAPLWGAVGLFIIGLVIAGTAESMEMLVAGRLIQGLGIGGQTVALYVVVARVYPARLHGAVFAVFSAAWVVPSLIGPFLAGAVAEYLHWRFVFLGVAVLAAMAFAVVAYRLHHTPLDAEPQPQSRTVLRIVLAVVIALLATLLSMIGSWQRPLQLGTFELPVLLQQVGGAVLLLALIAVCIRPLLPQRTLSSARGLPSVVLMRGLIAGTMFGAEVYIPYLLRDDYAFPPMWSGLALTGAAIMWAVGAEVQGRLGDTLGNTRVAVIGITLLGISVAAVAATAITHAPAWIIMLSWSLAGAGMGLMYPRLTVLTLAYSTSADQGFNSSALSIADSLMSSAAVAVSGLVFIALGGAGAGAFGGVFLFALVLCALALIPGLRLNRPAA